MISIGIPSYNGENWIEKTLRSILSQDFSDYEIVISDDHSTDNTLQKIQSIHDPRIKVFVNDINVGYGKNLKILNTHLSGDIIFLMGQDDILLKGALRKTYNAFMLDDEIGAVTRPYFWFQTDITSPVRAVFPYDNTRDAVLSIWDSVNAFNKIFESVGQLSGLAYRRAYMDVDFHDDIFPAHIYPFASISKKHKIVFLKDFTVAVRIESSQTRFLSKIYEVSPTSAWIKMFKTVYSEERFLPIQKHGIDLICSHFVGLIQIKNYSSIRNLLREIRILIVNRPLNLLNLKFWLFCAGTVCMPRRLLRLTVDKLKKLSLGSKPIEISSLLP